MRQFSYKATVALDLLELRASVRDVQMIGKAVRGLAAGELHGFKHPLQPPGQVLYQFRAGRFRVNYSFTENELIVESVTL